MQRKARAKINSWLEVLGRREDGYHEIRTLFHEIGIHDILKFSLTDDATIKILTSYRNLSGPDNLIFRIAKELQSRFNVQAGVSVVLEKRIPVAAGLGGGSSDGAQTILALNELWELGLTDGEMHRIAAQFGSDLNFFLVGGTAVGTGRGERICPVGYVAFDHLLLVNPGFAVSSGEAYQAIEQPGEHGSWEAFLTTGDPSLAFNALETGVRRLYPVVNEIIETIGRAGLPTILSGSGPTVIGFCPDHETGERLALEFRRKGYWCEITHTINKWEAECLQS